MTGSSPAEHQRRPALGVLSHNGVHVLAQAALEKKVILGWREALGPGKERHTVCSEGNWPGGMCRQTAPTTQPASCCSGKGLTLTCAVSGTGRSSSPYTRTMAGGAPSHVAMSPIFGMVADTATKRTEQTGVCRAAGSGGGTFA